jgi:hypothetical protein
MSEILFAAEVALRRLHGCMPEQELNLLQLSSTVMTQFRARAPQIMGCNMFQASSLAAGSDYVPDNVLRDAVAPYLSQSGDRSEDFAFANPSGLCPLIEGGFYPIRNGHGPLHAHSGLRSPQETARSLVRSVLLTNRKAIAIAALQDNN